MTLDEAVQFLHSSRDTDVKFALASWMNRQSLRSLADAAEQQPQSLIDLAEGLRDLDDVQ